MKAEVMKRRCLVIVMMLLICAIAAACGESSENGNGPMRYSKTMNIDASLSISGGTANCSGWVTPYGAYDCSLTVSLYQQNGTSWLLVCSWSTSATGGETAAISRPVSVSSGTYKVVSTGNVDGEPSSATSGTITF